MKKKVLFCILVIFLIGALVCALTACKKDTTEDEIIITSIEMNERPNEYYIIGENIDYYDGSIVVHRYNKTKNIAVDDIVVPLSNDDISLGNKGGNKIEGSYKVSVKYMGFDTTYEYCVQTEKNAVESVEFEVKDYFQSLVYAITDNRPTYDSTRDDDGYISDFSGLFLTVKYRDTSKSNTVYDLSSIFSFTASDVSCSGFDVTTLGQRDLIFKYKVSEFKVPYEVVDYDWIDDFKFVRQNDQNEYEEVSALDYIKQYYVIGDDFDSNGVKLKYIYNSLIETDVYDIKVFEEGKSYSKNDPILYGFDTSMATENGKRTMIVTTEYGSASFNYYVYEKDDITGMMVKNVGTAEMEVKTNVTYEEYLKTISLELVADDESKIEVLGNDEKILIYYKTDDMTEQQLLTESAYNTLVTKGQYVDIYATYKYNTEISGLVCKLPIRNEIIKVDIQNWVDNGVYESGAEFSFGSATIQYFFNDGTESAVYNIQDFYDDFAKNDLIYTQDKTAGTFNAITAKFDMTSSHDKNTDVKYFLYFTTDGEIWINGEKTDIDSGRVYISYTIQ